MLVSKYCDHAPLYRQNGIYARAGVDLDRSTLADWVGQSAALLAPLAEAITRHVKSGATLHADDTPVPVLNPAQQETKTGRLWVLVRDERPWAGPSPPAVTYFYSPDRKGEHAQTLLDGCRGFLHADGYAGFNRLYEPAELAPLTEIGCWAHARRKLYDVHATTNSPLARDALERIGQLFAIEAEINGHAPQHRLATRQELSLPKLDALRRFLDQSLATISKKSSLAGAIRYSLARWPALCRFTTDGRLEMTNNAAERAIRPLALGRKNSYDRCQDLEVKGSVPLLAATSFAVDGQPVELRTSSCFDGRSNSYSGIGYPMMTVRRKAASIWLRASDGAGPNFCSRIPSTALDALSTAGCR